MLTDRTEVDLAVDALRCSETKYHRLFESGGIGNAEIRLDSGRFLRVNRQYSQLTGYSETELLGMTFLDITHPDDRASNREAIRPFMEDRDATFDIEQRFVRKDGTVVWVHLTETPIWEKDGCALRLLGSAQDITERKAAEESLRAWTAPRNFAFVSTGMGMWVNMMPLGRLDWDDRAKDLFFVPPGVEATAELFWSRLHPDDWEPTRLAVEAAVRDRTLYAIDHRAVDPATGETRWIRSEGRATYAEDGSPVRFAGVSYDITERRRVEESLRFQLDLTRSITDNATTAIFMMDDMSRCTFMNPAAEQMTGFTFEEVKGGILHDFIHHHYPNGNPYLMPDCPIVRALADHFEVRDHEDVFIRKNGDLFPVLCNARGIYKEGKAVGTVIEVRDTTKEREAAEVLRLQTDRSTRLVQSNIIGVIFGDMERISEANDAFLEMVGYRRAELEAGQLHWRAMTPPQFAPANDRAIEELHRCGVCKPFQKEYYRKDGSRVPILIGTAMLDTATWVCFVQDMSRVKQVEAELRDADRRKDEFLATLAHELRNPLAPIRNGLQIMKLPEVNAGTVEKARSMMERQVEQMTQLIDDLMDVSRINQGKIQLQKTRMPLADAVRNAIDTSRALIAAPGHELVVDLPPKQIYVDGDLTRLSQVFANLLNNAAKYTDRGGRIRLTVERQGSDAVVSVADNGVGIRADMLARVFDMFAQIDGSVEKSQGGLGIGLNIVKRLVEMHGGSINAESGGPGKGSTFTVRLPVLIEELKTQGPPDLSRESIKIAACRILVVDDNRDAAVSLAMLLKIGGHDTQVAHDGVEAVAKAADFKPDIVLLDIGLPKMNGYDACREIRKQPWRKDIVIVALTGWGQDGDRRKSSEAGFDGHLVKPANHATLMKLLSELQVHPVQKHHTEAFGSF